MENKAFWSYDTEIAEICDDLIIEQALIFGEIEDIIAIFKLYDFKMIKDIWVKKLVPQNIYYKDNFYLGKIFFGIEDIADFIKENSVRYSRVQGFINN